MQINKPREYRGGTYHAIALSAAISILSVKWSSTRFKYYIRTCVRLYIYIYMQTYCVGRRREMDSGTIFSGRCTERTTNSRHISGLFDIQRVHKIDCAQPCSFCIMPGREISIQDVDFSGPPVMSLPRFISYTLDIFAAVKRTYETEIELEYRAYITQRKCHFLPLKL